MLAVYLAGRDVPCPRCGYNLRDLPGDRCPECRNALALRLGVAEPRLAMLLAGLIGLSAGAGLSGLLVFYWFIVAVVRSRGGGDWALFLAMTAIPFAIEGATVLAWLRNWSRLRRAPPVVRWGLVAAAWALTLAKITVFSVTIK